MWELGEEVSWSWIKTCLVKVLLEVGSRIQRACKLRNNLKYWEFLPRMSSTVIYDGCNSTEAWTSLVFPRLVTVLAESKRENSTFWELFQRWPEIAKLQIGEEIKNTDSESHSPPQQKPATPTAETPFLFKAWIIGFASSELFPYKFNMQCKHRTKCGAAFKNWQFAFMWNLCQNQNKQV